MRMTVKVGDNVIDNVRKRLGSLEKKTPNVISNALNRTMTNMATNVSKEVRARYVKVKAKDINSKDVLYKKRSTRKTLSASLEYRGLLLPLDRFKVSPKTVNPRRKSPIKASVKKSNGVKPLMGAFIADINGIKVFERTSKSRLPIRRLFGPSVPQMIRNEDIKETVERKGMEKFNERIDHEIKNILRKGRG